MKILLKETRESNENSAKMAKWVVTTVHKPVRQRTTVREGTCPWG